MQRIKNQYYRKFLDTGEFQTINETQLKDVLNRIKSRYKNEARALLILLYYTGARPAEALKIKSMDITKDARYILIKIKGVKRGLPRTIYLKNSNPLIKELYTYASGLFPEMLCFYHFANKYVRTFKTKKGMIKQREETTSKLYYHFCKWFENVIDISPYYLRHNRFSKLAEKGADLQQLRMLKGSKTMESVMPYIHMTTKSAKDLAKKMD